MSLLLLYFTLSPAQAQPAQASLEEALAVHITPQGLDGIGDVVAALLPASFSVEAGTGSFDCSEDTTLSYTLDALDLQLQVDDVALVPVDGGLSLTIYGTLSSNASTLAVTGDCSVLEDLDEVCGLQIPTTALEVGMNLDIAEVDGGLTATAEPPAIALSPIGNPLSDCTAASAIGTLLGQDPYAISDLILAQVEPSLDVVPALIAGSLGGALESLSFETELALLEGAAVGLALRPSRVEIASNGLILGMAADLTLPEVSECVDASAGPQLSGAGWPELDGVASGSSLAYDAGILVNRDFADQLLWMVWASGVLCQDLADLNGAPLNTSLLAAFFGPELSEVFGDDTPARVRLVPAAPPVAAFSDDQPPISMVLSGLQLHLYSVLEHRMTRALEVDIDGEVGVGLDLAGGELTGEILLEPEEFALREAYSELLWPGYSADLPGLLDVALRGLVPDDLIPQATLPSLLGAELTGPVWIPAEDGSWLGGYMLLDTSGVQPISVSGCSADSLGCGGEGGGGVEIDLGSALGCGETSAGCEGCAAGRPVKAPLGRLLPALLVLAGAARRRRG